MDLTFWCIQNDGDVKIVVGDNFDDIVLDESKDVLLEVLLQYHSPFDQPIWNSCLLIFFFNLT